MVRLTLFLPDFMQGVYTQPLRPPLAHPPGLAPTVRTTLRVYTVGILQVYSQGIVFPLKSIVEWNKY